jgi:hypothetical protein
MQTKVHFSSRATPWVVTGLLAEGYAVVVLLQHLPLMAAVSLHCLAALAHGVAAANGQPLRRRGPALAVFLLGLSLPVVGALGVCAVVLPAWRARCGQLDDGVLELAMPDFKAPGEPAAAPVPKPIEFVLRTSASRQLRVEAVMALRLMDAHHAVPLLRVALGDRDEDVRLLAYGILERREKELRGSIELALQELEPPSAITADAPVRQRSAVLRTLAELHWELVHAGFVGGELRATTLRDATRYGDAALRLQPDGSLALLLGRVRLRDGDAEGALHYLRAAAQLGIADTALSPFFAEAAFLMRRFDVIAALLAHSGPVQSPRPGLDAVVRFWSGQTAS